MSGLFGRPSNSMQQEVYTGIQVTTSLLGGVIPYVAGRTRVKMNLLWYGNFKVSTSNAGGGKGGGSGGTKQYSYSAAWIAGLCVGPIQGTFNIWHDRMLLNGSSSANLTYENLALALGSSGQAVWGGFPAGTPAVQQIPYDHIAYVASSAYNFGASAAMPQLQFEVEGVVPGYSDANSVFDADPSATIPDYLLDSVHGALGNYPGTTLTIGSADAPLTGATNSYQAYVMSMNLLTSPYEANQRQSTDFLTEILDCTNSNVWLSCDTLKVIPYCDQAVSGTVAGTAFSYTPNLTPLYIFGDDDYCPVDGDPPVKLNRKPQSDSFNMLNVQYVDRSDYYNTATVPSSDLNDIAKYGPRLAPSKNWGQITQAQVARTAGQLWLQRQLYERNSYTIRVRRNYALAEGMDFIALTSSDPNLPLAGQLCQITEVETEDDDKGSHLIITAREIPGVTRTTAQYNWSGSQGYFANYAADPGAVQTPAIFMMPPVPAALSEGINLGIAVCGQTGNAAWLGCDAYCSVDGGTTYQYVGTVPEACRYGTITANLAAAADPDSTNTLSVALANTNLQLSTSVTHAEADSGQTLMLVDAGTNAEVLAYGAASLVSAGHYNLTYLRRGLYGSNDVLHNSGAQFVRLDGAVFQLALDPGMAGQTVYFKFVSFNTFTRYGQQTLAGATAYSYTLPTASVADASPRLIPRGSCSVNSNGTQVYKATTGAVAWDSDANSPQPFLNGCFISWRASNTPPSGEENMGGFSTAPLATLSYTGLNFALYTNAGTVYIYESGVNLGTFGSYVAGDAFELRYDGVTVRYFHNGALLKGTRAPGLTLYPKVVMAIPGSSMNAVAFGPVSGVTQPGANWLNSYPWVVGSNVSGSQGNYVSINNGAAGSGIVLGGTGSNPFGPYGGTEPLWLAIGNGINNADGGWNNSGDLQGIDPTKTYRSCVWFYYSNTGTLSGEFFHGCDQNGATKDLSGTVDLNPYFQSGTLLSSLIPNKWYLSVGFIHGSGYGTTAAGIGGIYDPVTGVNVVPATEFKQTAGDTFQEHRAYLYYTTTAGVSLWMARPRFEEVNGNEISIQALLAPAANIWVALATPAGGAFAGVSTAKKWGGASAWDSAVYSAQAGSPCHVQAKWDSLSLNVMVGLAVNPLASVVYTNLAYAWYNASGTYEIFESGTNVTPGGLPAVALTDRVAVVWDSVAGTITYLLNGVSKRTVTGVTSPYMHGMVCLYSPNVGVNSLSFGPTTTLDVIDTTQVNTNAVTDVVTATGSASLVHGSFTSACSVTVGPYQWPTTVVVTASCELDQEYTGGTVAGAVWSMFASTAIHDSVSSSFYSQNQTEVSTAQTNTATATNQITAEYTFSLAANTTATYQWGGNQGTPSQVTDTMANAVIKAEVIKK